MGTNYYTTYPQRFRKSDDNFEEASDIELLARILTPAGLADCNWNDRSLHNRHVGKLSGAGNYCFKCKISLHKGGEKDVHSGSSAGWWTRCPICMSANEGNFGPVKFAFSWTWALPQEEVIDWCTRHGDSYCVKDEYGAVISGRELLRQIEECPIQFSNLIGTEFS